MRRPGGAAESTVYTTGERGPEFESGNAKGSIPSRLIEHFNFQFQMFQIADVRV
jgi:hypothetical protein